MPPFPPRFRLSSASTSRFTRTRQPNTIARSFSYRQNSSNSSSSSSSSNPQPTRPIPFPIKLVLLSSLIGAASYHAFPMQQTSGPSMLPTILVNDGVIWNPRYARGRGLRVNDMVAAWSPYEPGGSIVKRVVGMPGDVVCVLRKHGAKGEGEDESEGRYIVVPSGHCWVEGDNVPWSVDSRHYGPLPLGLVAGKVVAIRGAKPWSWRWVGNERLESVEVEDVFGD